MKYLFRTLTVFLNTSAVLNKRYEIQLTPTPLFAKKFHKIPLFNLGDGFPKGTPNFQPNHKCIEMVSPGCSVERRRLSQESCRDSVAFDLGQSHLKSPVKCLSSFI